MATADRQTVGTPNPTVPLLADRLRELGVAARGEKDEKCKRLHEYEAEPVRDENLLEFSGERLQAAAQQSSNPSTMWRNLCASTWTEPELYDLDTDGQQTEYDEEQGTNSTVEDDSSWIPDAFSIPSRAANAPTDGCLAQCDARCSDRQAYDEGEGRCSEKPGAMSVAERAREEFAEIKEAGIVAFHEKNEKKEEER